MAPSGTTLQGNSVEWIVERPGVSGGLATFPWDAQNLHDLMVVADGELMRAKSMGKNAIVLAGPEQTPPSPPAQE